MKTLVQAALIGAGSFWIPDVVIHAIAGRAFSGIHVLLLTVILPLAFTFAYVAIKRHNRESRFVAFAMVVGLWLLGGVFMLIGASFSEGGFTVSEPLRDTIFGILVSFLPPYTFMMATYDGTLFALLFATIAPVFAALAHREEKGKNRRTAV